MKNADLDHALLAKEKCLSVSTNTSSVDNDEWIHEWYEQINKYLYK
jgi:hypothetical protein